MSNVKARYRHASFDEALEALKKRKPAGKNSFMRSARMFRKKKKLWEDDEYEKTESIHATGITNKQSKPKVSLPNIQFTKRRLDGET